jgi:hypothetical protein
MANDIHKKLEILRKLQDKMDSTASGRRLYYQSATNLISWVPSSIATVKADALAFVAWRDAIWTYLAPIFAQIDAGTDAQTPDQIIAGLPNISWP